MQLDEDTYLAKFGIRELDPEHFDHHGHLYMAWLHLTRYSLEEANLRVCDGIRDLAAKFNDPDKFSHTLTEALMRIMAKRMRDEAQQDFEDFLENNPDLVDDAQGVLLRYYSEECLNSPEARSAWVDPDLAPIE
ncbi:MAG: hypothetical protein KZQ99_08465 [Candidatus Thiodiazotropha sp. (ex Dulcina madagascariensis)]|nr:hypothetical protein [Candidatus Thiodiazotropha sp. (ex Dulcina madagascariensis)]